MFKGMDQMGEMGDQRKFGRGFGLIKWFERR